MRNDQTVPSYNVNPKNGFLYVAYQSSEFRSDQLQQIGLVTSRDGGKTWSGGVQVNRTPANAANPQAFAPFVAVTKNGRVGVLYFDFRKDDRLDPSQTNMDAWLAIYQEVEDPNGGSTQKGLDFVKEIRLSKVSYIAQNGPLTTLGFSRWRLSNLWLLTAMIFMRSIQNRLMDHLPLQHYSLLIRFIKRSFCLMIIIAQRHS